MRLMTYLLFLTSLMVIVAPAVAAELDLSGLPPYSPDATADRSEIPAVYQWDLTVLCQNQEEADQRATEAKANLERLEGLVERIGSAQELADALQLSFKLDRDVNLLTLYANLQRERETTNQTLIARHQLALGLLDELMAQGPKLRKAILDLTKEELAAAYQAVPTLTMYQPFIEAISRRKGCVLDEEAERVLALAGDNLWAQIDLNEIPAPIEEAFVALRSDMQLPKITDADGNEVQLNLSNYSRYRADANREVRRQAVAALMGNLRQYENTLAATLAGQAKLDVFLARARRYDTALEAYLDKDNLDPAVYQNLVTTVHANTKPLHRYVELRKRLMKVDTVHLYDLYIPLVEGVTKDVPFAEGAEIIINALKPLGPVYGEVLARAIDPRNGWLDLYPSRDKNSGAFSSAVYGVHPFVKMNYQDSFDDVSTLAHELGHALHSHLSMTSQPYVTARYVSFLAEIASTCNEMLLSQYLLDNAGSDQERAWLISELLESIRTTIYRQTLFAEFELALHQLVEEGTPVTADTLNKTYGDLIHHYYGPAYTVDKDDALEWAYIPHFYWKYYVFNYATGLSSGIALAEGMATGDQAARDAYLAMLRSGSDRPPLEILRGAGVDLTSPAPIEAAIKLFDHLLDELEQLVPEQPVSEQQAQGS